MPIATRLTNTGTLLVNGSFDEVTSIAPAKFRTASTTVYAGMLDEVTGMVATNGLLLYVNVSSGVYSGSGTQWTDLSTYNNNATLTNSPTYSSTTGGGSFNFNGTSQFASVTPALLNTTYTGKTVFVVCRMSSAGWTPGVAQYRAMFGTGTGTRNFNFYVYHTAANTYQLHFSVSGSATITTDVAIVPDTWMILAVTQDTTVTYYVNGVSVYSAAGQTLSQYAAGGNEAVARADNYWSGDIAVCLIYSRTLSSAEILNNYNAFASRVGLATSTISNRQNSDGTLSVNTQFDEFTGAPVVDSSLMVWVDAAQIASYSGSGATWTDLSGNGKNYTLSNSPTFSSATGGGVITFAGASSQYATTATTLFNSTTTNTYTMNLWVYPTGAGQLVAVTGQATINTSYHYSAMEISAAGVIKFGQWTGGMTTIATSTQSLNAWYNLVITYNGTTATAYINGTSVGSSNIIWSAPGANTFFPLMAIDGTNMGTNGYASGSVGAFMAYNRALSVDEVTTNFNALRGRYGI